MILNFDLSKKLVLLFVSLCFYAGSLQANPSAEVSIYDEACYTPNVHFIGFHEWRALLKRANKGDEKSQYLLIKAIYWNYSPFDLGKTEINFKKWNLFERAKNSDLYVHFLLVVCPSKIILKKCPDLIENIKKRAEAGNAAAQLNLGYAFCAGEDIELNREESLKWYMKAAEQGFITAYYQLGCFYVDEEKYPEAFEWYKRAAENNWFFAAYMMVGNFYETGEGVEQDYEAAFSWYLRALSGEDDSSECNEALSFLEKVLDPLKKSEIKMGDYEHFILDLEEKYNTYLDKINTLQNNNDLCHRFAISQVYDLLKSSFYLLEKVQRYIGAMRGVRPGFKVDCVDLVSEPRINLVDINLAIDFQDGYLTLGEKNVRIVRKLRKFFSKSGKEFEEVDRDLKRLIGLYEAAVDKLLVEQMSMQAKEKTHSASREDGEVFAVNKDILDKLEEELEMLRKVRHDLSRLEEQMNGRVGLRNYAFLEACPSIKAMFKDAESSDTRGYSDESSESEGFSSDDSK